MEWISVNDKLPDGVYAFDCDSDADYDEDEDEYYHPEGWWKIFTNWDEYCSIKY